MLGLDYLPAGLMLLRSLRIEPLFVLQAALELPLGIDWKRDRRPVFLQSLYLLSAHHGRLFVEVGLVKHRHTLADGVAGDQSNVFVRDVLVVELCGDGVAEGMEPDTSGEAKVFHVAAELTKRCQAVASVGLTGLTVHTSGQVWEKARVPALSDVIHEVQEAYVKQRLGDRDRSDRGLAF